MTYTPPRAGANEWTTQEVRALADRLVKEPVQVGLLLQVLQVLDTHARLLGEGVIIVEKINDEWPPEAVAALDTDLFSVQPGGEYLLDALEEACR